jgi:RNA polymerase-binding transcription factor DksA
VASNKKRTRSAGKSGLTAKDIRELRELLLAKRAELVGDMNHMSDEALRRNNHESSGNLSSMPIHMADIGTDNYEQEFTLGLLESERTILREIDEALERIANKTYGICLATGLPIGKARLLAHPWAKYSYAHTLELERRRTRGY